MFKTITSQNFKRYGKIIEYPNKASKGRVKNLFRIVHCEAQKKGWRIAYLIVRDKAIGRLEKHPDSFESFEPIAGKSLLYVAADQNLDQIECFLLDRPVVLKRGIWHGIVTLDQETEFKLTENAQVKCVYWRLPHKLNSHNN